MIKLKKKPVTGMKLRSSTKIINTIEEKGERA